MKNNFSFKILSIFLIIFFVSLQNISGQESLFKSFNDEIPTDSSITIKKLDNNFTYYVKENKKPENRIILRLVVNAGSIQEDDNQLGLAHFLEHMAFNGTENFPGNELVDFLEREGVRFGPDLNAYTGYDNTVYLLDIPAGREEVLDKVLLILHDWASAITNAQEQIDKERGVVIEEWRRSLGASERIAEIQRKAIFGDSRYADRSPIGTIEILENFKRDELISFYKEWYRPDLFALVVVGNLDKNAVSQKIENLFSNLKPAENPRERIYYPVPDKTQNVISIAKDSEAVSAEIKVIYLFDNPGQSTVRDYRDSILASLYISMLNTRYIEKVQTQDPPFASAGVGAGSLVRTKSAFSAVCTADPDDMEKGFAALLEELVRAKQHGFTASEVSRAKESHMKSFEQLYREADNTRSEILAAEYTRNYLEGEYVPGIEYEYKLTKELLAGITSDEINKLSDKFIKDNGAIILVSYPDSSAGEGNEITEARITEIFNAAFNTEFEEYIDNAFDGTLVDNLPEPGKAEQNYYDNLKKVYYYTASNGAKIVIKPTDFKNDQIAFTSFSYGGASLADNNEWVSANYATSVVSRGRLGGLSKPQLDKFLQGKVVSLSPYIYDTSEGFSGVSSVDDLETMFELLYLYFNDIEKDNAAFSSYITRLEIYLKNQEMSPDVVFGQTFVKLLANGNPRAMPIDSASIKEIDIDKAYSFFKNRFSNPGDFTYIFTGSAGPEVIIPLFEKYLAYKPAGNTERKNSWKDNNIRLPKGKISKTIYMGKEEKAQIVLAFNGSFDWSRENVIKLRALTETADMRLRNVIREEEGGTYSISVYPSISKYPVSQYQIVVFFACSPERVEDLKKITMEELAALSENVPEGTLIKFKNASLLEYRKQLKENAFWLSVIKDSEFDKSNLKWLDLYEMMIENITDADIMKTAAKYLNINNMVDLTMYPENRNPEAAD